LSPPEDRSAPGDPDSELCGPTPAVARASLGLLAREGALGLERRSIEGPRDRDERLGASSEFELSASPSDDRSAPDPELGGPLLEAWASPELLAREGELGLERRSIEGPRDRDERLGASAEFELSTSPSDRSAPDPELASLPPEAWASPELLAREGARVLERRSVEGPGERGGGASAEAFTPARRRNSRMK